MLKRPNCTNCSDHRTYVLTGDSYSVETCNMRNVWSKYFTFESVNIRSTRNENRYLERLAIVYWTGKRFKMDAMPLTQQCVKRRHNHAFWWPGIDRKRPDPRLMILGMILCGRSYKIADTFCPDGYARPGMRATRLPSNLEAPRSTHTSPSLDDTVLFGRRLTVRLVSFPPFNCSIGRLKSLSIPWQINPRHFNL